MQNIAENKGQLIKLAEDSSFIENKEQLAVLLAKAADLFQQTTRTDQQRRQLLQTFLGSCTLKDHRLHPKLRQPFDQLVKLKNIS